MANVFSGDKIEGLEDIPEFYIELFRYAIPGTSNFEVMRSEHVDLAGGVEGHLAVVGLTWVDGTTRLEVGLVGAFADTELVLVQAIMVEGIASMDDLLGLCLTLDVSKS